MSISSINTKIIDGKLFAEQLRENITKRVAKLKASRGITPGLAVVLVGENPASIVYVRNKSRQTIAAGMNSFEYKLPDSVPQSELLALIEQLNSDQKIHGILVQLPLPAHISEEAVIQSIAPEKDVDGFHVINAGKLATNQNGFIPCTPLGCLMLLKDNIKNISGLHAVIIGRSNIVGKPMAQLLLRENCTVTIAHSKTTNLPQLLKNADIVVAAVGKPQMVKGEWLKPGATIIDVGINRLGDKLVGDVDFASCQNIAAAITPVPGGVGPMTIACLLENTLLAASF